MLFVYLFSFRAAQLLGITARLVPNLSTGLTEMAEQLVGGQAGVLLIRLRVWDGVNSSLLDAPRFYRTLWRQIKCVFGVCSDLCYPMR